MVTDDFDGVLVGTYCTFRTETIEFALCGAWFHDGDFLLDRERLECDVIYDTDGEIILRLSLLKIVEYGNDLCRGGVL